MSTWSNLLIDDISMGDDRKARFAKVIEHFYDRYPTPVPSQKSIEDFLIVSKQRFHPPQDRFVLWQDALQWLFMAMSKDWETRLIFEIRRRNMALSTEQTYLGILKAFLAFHHHPTSFTTGMIGAYLSHNATVRNHSINTQKQALNGLVFFYRNVLEMDLEEKIQFQGSTRGRKVPEVLAEEQVRAVFQHLPRDKRLMTALLYGSGLRISELLNLRIKDFNFYRHTISVYESKQNKDRMVMLPHALVDALQEYIQGVRHFHEADRREGQPGVYLPHALSEKYPSAATSLDWFWAF